MQAGAERGLTDREWASLSPGLAEALHAAQIAPRIVARTAIGARIAAIWRGSAPILAWGRSLYWPGAPQDASGPWRPGEMATLQHELHHLWEYAAGALTPLRYGVNPHNWSYAYKLERNSQWSDFGAEQRASIAEDLWLIEHGLLQDPHRGAWHRALIPWAVQSSS
jgi:hypothetical protein